jgi:putative aldouronate transport system substrate-binding protein
LKKKAVIISIIIVALVIGIIITVKSLNKPSTYDALIQMDEKTPSSDSKGNNSDKKQASDLKEETLTFYFVGDQPNVDREILDEVEKQVKGLNIKLDFKYIRNRMMGSDYINNIKTLINSGAPLDAFYYSPALAGDLSSLVSQNLIMDLTSLSKDCAPNYFSKFSKEELASASISNKLYAIPNQMPVYQRKYVLVNENLMSKYNIPEIKSYKDFELYLKSVKENEPGIIPLKFSDTPLDLFAEANGYAILDVSKGLVYKWNDPNIKVMAWEKTPEFKNSLLTMINWRKQNYFADDIKNVPINETVLNSGKWASFIVSPDAQLAYKDMLNGKSVIKYKLYPLYPDNPSKRILLQNGMLISKNSKHADRVLMFYDWLTSDQSNYDSLMYGVKGKHYDLKSENVIPMVSLSDEDQLNWPWKLPFQVIAFERGNSVINKSDIEDYIKKVDKDSIYAPDAGFNIDYSNLKEATQRKFVFNDINNKILTGEFKESDLNALINDIKGQGVDNVVAEAQRQLDSWRQKN